MAYVDTRRETPNVTSEVVNTYLGIRVPVLMAREQARLKALDPTSRLQFIASARQSQVELVKAWTNLRIQQSKETQGLNDAMSAAFAAQKTVEAAEAGAGATRDAAQMNAQSAIDAAEIGHQRMLDEQQWEAYRTAQQAASPAGQELIRQLAEESARAAKALDSGESPDAVEASLNQKMGDVFAKAKGLSPDDFAAVVRSARQNVGDVRGATSASQALVRRVVASQLPTTEDAGVPPKTTGHRTVGYRKPPPMMSGAERGKEVADALNAVKEGGISIDSGGGGGFTPVRSATTTPMDANYQRLIDELDAQIAAETDPMHAGYQQLVGEPQPAEKKRKERMQGLLPRKAKKKKGDNGDAFKPPETGITNV